MPAFFRLIVHRLIPVHAEHEVGSEGITVGYVGDDAGDYVIRRSEVNNQESAERWIARTVAAINRTESDSESDTEEN